MFNLYFISPTVLFALAVIFPVFINSRIPLWVNVDIGKIHTEDILKMNPKQVIYLKRKIRTHLTLAFISTLVISTTFYIFINSNPILSIITCNLICIILGLCISLSILKTANELKNELDN